MPPTILAVSANHTGIASRPRGEPFHQLRPARVGTETTQRVNRRPHRDLSADQFDLRGPIDQQPADQTMGLQADEDDAGSVRRCTRPRRA